MRPGIQMMPGRPLAPRKPGQENLRRDRKATTISDVNGGLNPRLSGDYRSALVLGALRLAPAVGGQGVRPDLRRPEPGATFGGIFGWGLGAVARLTTARARGKSLPLLRGKHGADLNLAVWLDAVPHTVLGTNAGRVFRQSDRSSTPDLRGRRGRMR